MRFIFYLNFIIIFFIFFSCSEKRAIKKTNFIKPNVSFSEVEKVSINANEVLIDFSIFVENQSHHNIKVKLRDLTAYSIISGSLSIMGKIKQLNDISHFHFKKKKELLLRLTIDKKRLIEQTRNLFFNNDLSISIKGNLSIVLPFIILDYPLYKEFQFRLFDN